MGRTMLSWPDFEQGYLIPDDKYNLGLHELAHSLWFNYFDSDEIRASFDEFHVTAMREMQRMCDAGDGNFLRAYAETNIEEFWACSVEAFFEAPLEFKAKLPLLYDKVANVLKQDMAQRVLCAQSPSVVNAPAV